jgi:ribonuclease Y
MELFVFIPIVLVAAGLMFYGGWYLNARSGQNKIASAQERAKRILDDAEKDASTLKREKLLEAKDEWFISSVRQGVDEELNKLKAKEIRRLEGKYGLDMPFFSEKGESEECKNM